jgi:hypothetical protein
MDDAIKRLKSGGNLIAHLGAPYKFFPESRTKLKEEVIKHDMCGDSIIDQRGDVVRMIDNERRAYSASHGLNGLAVLEPLSATTVRRIVKAAAPHVVEKAHLGTFNS